MYMNETDKLNIEVTKHKDKLTTNKPNREKCRNIVVPKN